MVDSKHQWKAWIYLLPAIILLLIFTVWPIINTVVTAFIYDIEYGLAAVQVEAVDGAEGEYRFYRPDSENKKHYISVGKDENGVAELQYSTDASCAFKYDSEIGAWTTVSNGKTYFIGADKSSDLNLVELTDAIKPKIGVSVYPACIYKDVPNNYVTADFDEKAGYNMGVFKGLPEAYVYAMGAMDDGYVNATSYINDAANVWPEVVKVNNVRGYKLYVEMTEEKIKSYMSINADEEGNLELRYTESTEDIFFYNKEKEAWTCTSGETEYYLAIDSVNNRLSIFPLAEVAEEGAPAPASFYLHRSGASEAKKATSMMQDYAYRIGAHRSASGTQTYLADTDSKTSGLMLIEDTLGKKDSGFGIKNFTMVLTDPGSDFMQCLINTLILTVITVPISTILALLIAVALNSIKPLQKLLQTIFFLPYVTNSIAIGMVFSAMFNIVNIGKANESIGMINTFLGLFGIERINWINQNAPAWASFAALIIYIVWNALPFKILILLGGLQNVNKQYYDAAKVDGTPKWRVLLRITVPLLSPMITYTVITSFIGGFKEYSSVVGMFGDNRTVPGGTGFAKGNMNTIVGHIQDQIALQDYGIAGAAALILFVIIFAVTLFNLWVSKKTTHY